MDGDAIVKAFHIDATAREVREVEATGLKDFQRLVGGYIELAWVSRDSGDTLFVDEEGMLKAKDGFFRWEHRRHPMPLAGSGVLVGRELNDDEGEFLGNADPAMTLEQVQQAVTFLTREQAMAWGKGNASEPAATLHTLDKSFNVTDSTVLFRHGEVFANMPKPEDKA
jgi:hypothetical protein